MRPHPIVTALGLSILMWFGIVACIVNLVGCQTVPSKPVYDTVVEVTTADFADQAAEYDVTVVVFGAPWCHWCNVLEPKMDALAKRYAGQIKILHYNTDKNDPKKIGYVVEGIPFVVVRKAGIDVFADNLQDMDQVDRIVDSLMMGQQ